MATTSDAPPQSKRPKSSSSTFAYEKEFSTSRLWARRGDTKIYDGPPESYDLCSLVEKDSDSGGVRGESDSFAHQYVEKLTKDLHLPIEVKKGREVKLFRRLDLLLTSIVVKPDVAIYYKGDDFSVVFFLKFIPAHIGAQL